MIHHISIGVKEPERVARVLAELWEGYAMPFPVAEGGWLVELTDVTRLKKAEDEIARVDQKLNNESFISRAPEDVVQELRDKRIEFEATRIKVQEALKRVE